MRRQPDKEAFARAVADLIGNRSLAEVAQETGIHANTLGTWRSGRIGNPDPQAIFDFEERMGRRRGYLSEHLGYRPVLIDEDEPQPDCLEIVAKNDNLPPLIRQALLALLAYVPEEGG